MALYFMFMLPGILLMLWAQAKVKGSYAKYSKMANSRNMTGAQAARMVLNANGLHKVRIEMDQNPRAELSDHYDPRSRKLVLSRGIYAVPSIAAVAVAAHEAGHAIQHAQGYRWLTLRTDIVKYGGFAMNFGVFVLIAGLMMQISGLAWAGVALFSLTTVFTLVTLPVEFDATSRAKTQVLQLGIADSGISGGSEAQGIGKMLDAAAWTYVAAFVQSLMTLLYYVMLVTGMRRD